MCMVRVGIKITDSYHTNSLARLILVGETLVLIKQGTLQLDWI
jgi:hypothetical protein